MTWYTIAVGNPVIGFRLHGVYSNEADAERVLETWEGEGMDSVSIMEIEEQEQEFPDEEWSACSVDFPGGAEDHAPEDIFNAVDALPPSQVMAVMLGAIRDSDELRRAWVIERH